MSTSALTRQRPGIGATTGKAARQLALQTDLLRRVGPLGSMRWRHHMARKAPVEPVWRAERYRDMWVAAAADRGWSSTPMAGEAVRIDDGHRSVVVSGNVVGLDDAEALRKAGDRRLAREVLTAAGLPLPVQRDLHWRDLDAARSFLTEHGRVVVKPAGSTGRGTGVTCGVADVPSLRSALLRAAGWDTDVVLEAQVAGDEYRVLVLDGRAIAAVRREPPRVTGDGRRSVGDLLVAENAARRAAQGRRALWQVRIDLDCMLRLEVDGRTLRTVPAVGETVPLKSAVNENGAPDNHTVDPVPTSMARVAVDAAAALGSRLASVEVITPDVHRDVAVAGGAVLEVNTTPGLLYHVQVADPSRAVNPGVPILEVLLQEGDPL